MIEVRRLIQSTLLVLVLISSLLLGMSMESMRMIAIGSVGAVLGFLVADCFKLFNIRGFLANVASVVILFLAMKDFFSEDGMGKLVSVANLLVYLQIVLMFQEKTPRLIWQILVLSLLQVVVAAIFSLNFEAGLLFMLYFVVAGLAMVLQSVYTDAFGIKRKNRRSARLWKLRAQPVQSTNLAASDSQARTSNSEPIIFFEPPREREPTVRPLFFQLLMWIAVSGVFTSILFFWVPRHTAPWFGPASVRVSSTGVSKAVDLDERGLISQSNKLVFRVDFENQRTGEPVSIVGNPPYFRGLALSNLVIEDGKTNWRAPHDRVFTDVYQSIPYFNSDRSRQVLQKVSLEESTDPLVYGLMPFYRARDTPRELLFCHEISALTRCKTKEIIGLAPYSYLAETLVGKNGKFLDAWPYISNTSNFQRMPMSADPPQREWLTQMDPARYPSVVGLADRIEKGIVDQQTRSGRRRDSSAPKLDLDQVRKNLNLAADWGSALALATLPRNVRRWVEKRYNLPNSKLRAARMQTDDGIPRLVLLKEMEKHFLEPGRFKYTLDFRNVKRVDALDPIEDFVRNHRQGHCELFASALTVMLRYKKIPARLVVGFQGAKENTLSGSYMVREKNAHAWVEAYLRPQDCSAEMFETGQAGPGGAWLRLDPTPPSPGSQDSRVSEEAIDLARTAWDEYVLGMENQSTENAPALNSTLARFLRNLDVDRWDRRLSNMSKAASSPILKYLLAGLLLLVFFAMWLRNVLAGQAALASKAKEAGPLRRLLAGAISLIAPKLGQWVREGTVQTNSIGFYYRMTEILERHNLIRSPNQTHREFAGEVSAAFDSHPESGLISSTVYEVTELFNVVRFGNEELESDLASQIEISLNELDTALQVRD